MKRIALALMLSGTAMAQSVLNVATGSAEGTYSQMFKNLGAVCTSSSWLKERKTSGSLDNIELLLNNEVSMSFVQLDVLKAKQQIDKDPRADEIRTLVPLHPEEVHVFTSKGFSGNTFESLAPYTVGTIRKTTKLRNVGAWGGSVITAKVLSAMTGIKYNIVVVNDQKSAFAALQAGKLDAVIAVVGQPAAWVKSLPNSFKLLGFQNTVSLSKLYQPAKLFYSNLSLNSVNTVSIQSVLATRNFKTAEKRNQLLSYQSCISKKLPELQESEGMHAKWGQVNITKFLWPKYTGK